MPGNIGPLEIAIVLIVVLVIFGPKRLPELGKSLGKGIREFKGSIGGNDEEKHDEQTQIAAADPIPTPPAEKASEKSDAGSAGDKPA
jgi:sec-independent protein translocase protein TatA